MLSVMVQDLEVSRIVPFPIVVMSAPLDVMSRLGCARIVLARSKGTPQHEVVSRLQADAVLDLMGFTHSFRRPCGTGHLCRKNSRKTTSSQWVSTCARSGPRTNAAHSSQGLSLHWKV